jgi:hypothetical protein
MGGGGGGKERFFIVEGIERNWWKGEKGCKGLKTCE